MIKYVLPQMIGFVLMVAGWYVSIINVGLFKFNQERSLHTKETLFGLALILLGSYLPQIWISILNKLAKK
jgi:hypothetical protein